MTDLPQVEQLFADLAPTLDPDAIAYLAEDGCWTIQVDEATLIDVAFDQ